MVTLLSFIKHALSFRKTCRSVKFDKDFEGKYLLINNQHVAGEQTLIRYLRLGESTEAQASSTLSSLLDLLYDGTRLSGHNTLLHNPKGPSWLVLCLKDQTVGHIQEPEAKDLNMFSSCNELGEKIEQKSQKPLVQLNRLYAGYQVMQSCDPPPPPKVELTHH